MSTEQTTVADRHLVPIDYVPMKMRIEQVTQETSDVRTFRLGFCDPQQAESFTFRAGQFGLYSVFGAGEATFCIASSPTRRATSSAASSASARSPASCTAPTWAM